MKEFNITGVCVGRKHYVVDVSKKINQIIKLIEKEEYFTINRARQYGKTTILSNIYDRLKDKYLVIDISFEGIGDNAFTSEKAFVEVFIRLVSRRLIQNKVDQSIIKDWEEFKKDLDGFEELSRKITQLSQNSSKDIIILIDEVDKSSDNQLFLNFLGMLRNKYLDREKGRDSTFKSVILAGVYDVKNLKIKLRPDSEKKFNSPWNIAADFDVDMSFSSEEISSMLNEYEKDHNTAMDIDKVSKEIYKYTSGYPFLVSKVCKIVDEKLNKDWSLKGIEEATKMLTEENNTLFDDLIKNIENHKELYNTIFSLIVNNKVIQYNVHAHSLGIMYGILKNSNGRLTVHNKIYEIVLYNYMIAKKQLEDIGRELSDYSTIGMYEDEKGNLDIKKALLKYQEYMKSVYSKFDKEFIERQGRLLLLAFFKPIINGKGFYFVESHTGFEQRQDVVITYGDKKYIIELKIWRGEEYHKKGIEQLEGYLSLENLHEGYLVIYDKNENKEYKSKLIKNIDKQIFAIWV
ncbi:UNVERIFIED_CONTAM: hypothetical protein Cloal_3165 [Acetivibrio alkalicellulosi]